MTLVGLLRAVSAEEAEPLQSVYFNFCAKVEMLLIHLGLNACGHQKQLNLTVPNRPDP